MKSKLLPPFIIILCGLIVAVGIAKTNYMNATQIHEGEVIAHAQLMTSADQ